MCWIRGSTDVQPISKPVGDLRHSVSLLQPTSWFPVRFQVLRPIPPHTYACQPPAEQSLIDDIGDRLPGASHRPADTGRYEGSGVCLRDLTGQMKFVGGEME